MFGAEGKPVQEDAPVDAEDEDSDAASVEEFEDKARKRAEGDPVKSIDPDPEDLE